MTKKMIGRKPKQISTLRAIINDMKARLNVIIRTDGRKVTKLKSNDKYQCDMCDKWRKNKDHQPNHAVLSQM